MKYWTESRCGNSANLHVRRTDAHETDRVRADGFRSGRKKEAAIKIFLDTIAEYNADGKLYFNLQEFTLSIGASSVDIRLQKKIFIQDSRRKFSQRTHFLPEITVE